MQTGKISSDITIPNTVDKISPYAFAGNSNVETISFKSTPEIGDYAFSNCSNLSTVNFESYSTPIVGENIFFGNNVVIYVPYAAQEAYKSAIYTYASKIQSKEIQVIFHVEGQPEKMKVDYYGSVIDFDVLEEKGYEFGGWYDNEEFEGTPYKNGNHLEFTGDTLHLYAKLTPKTYTITLDPNGGQNVGENTVTVKYGSSFKIASSAIREGYTFDGWFDGKDSSATEYITATGESKHTWDIDGNVILYAHWTIESYEIQINNDGTITWLGKDGLSSDKCSIQYGTSLAAINLVPVFKQSGQGFKTGKIFDHFEYNDDTINWTSIPDLGENGSIITIKPIWILEVHTIYFQTMCEIIVSPIEAEYNANITLPQINRTGYTFNGWYKESSYVNKVNWTKMPDLTPNSQNNGSTEYFAKWSKNQYSVMYNANGGNGNMASVIHTYDIAKNLTKNIFWRTGYDFIGWSTSSDGNVEYYDAQSVINLTSESAGRVTLYAVWKAKTYSIICKNLMTNMFVKVSEYTYGEGLSTMPVVYVRDGYSERVLEDFYGWYGNKNFTDFIAYIPWNTSGDITVYAKYDYWVGDYSASGTQTVTDSSIYNQPSEYIDHCLNSFRYDQIKDTTLNTIKIKFFIRLWEVDDGYQDLYLYNGNIVVWSTTIDHGKGYKDTTPETYEFEFELRIDDYKYCDYFDFRFGAHGAFSDTWEFDFFELSMYFTNGD